MITADVIETCAADVAPYTIEQVIKVESRGDPLAINVNPKTVPIVKDGKKIGIKKVSFQLPIQITNLQDAVTVAQLAIDAGYSVDMGYMQINSKNLPKLGYTVSEIFNPCNNLKAGSTILKEGYSRASAVMGEGQDALRTALSLYNTGDTQRGFSNGYVARYYNAGNVPVSSSKNGETESKPIVINPYTASTTIADSNRNQTNDQDDYPYVDVKF